MRDGAHPRTPIPNRTIWLYWESPDGSPTPPIIEACIDTIKRNAGEADVVLMDAESASDYSGLLDPRWRSMDRIAHRADYLRARVLYEHGGLWCDVDTVALKDLSGCLHDLRDVETVGVRNAAGRPSVGFLAARQGSPAIKRWLAAQQALLTRTGFVVPAWNAIGSWELEKALSDQEVRWLESRHVKPIPWYEAMLFLSSVQAPRTVVPPESIVANLYASVYSALEGMTREELLSSNMLVCRLLRFGLGMDKPGDSWRPTDVLGAGERLWHRSRRTLARSLSRARLLRGH